jgi:hypothetical protein
MYFRNTYTVTAMLLIPTRCAIAPRPCTQFSPSPVPIQQLPDYFLPHHGPDVATLLNTEAIRQTLILYPSAIDGRAFASLSSIFATDAIANYSAPIGVLNGLPTITAALKQALASFTSNQHILGPQNVRICDGEKAISATYFGSVHFLPQNETVVPGDTVGADGVLNAYGQYQDTWEKRNGLWKIVYRNMVFMVGV